jgi:hypothetical protein
MHLRRRCHASYTLCAEYDYQFQDESDVSSADRQALPVLGHRVNKRSYKGDNKRVCLTHDAVTLIVACGDLLRFAGKNGRCLHLQNGSAGE